MSINNIYYFDENPTSPDTVDADDLLSLDNPNLSMLRISPWKRERITNWKVMEETSVSLWMGVDGSSSSDLDQSVALADPNDLVIPSLPYGSFDVYPGSSILRNLWENFERDFIMDLPGRTGGEAMTDDNYKDMSAWDQVADEESSSSS